MTKRSSGDIPTREITDWINSDWTDITDVFETVRARSECVFIVLTRRNAPLHITDVADAVSNRSDVKPVYRSGIRATKDVEL